MRQLKRVTAERVLTYRVEVAGSHGPHGTFHSREAADAEAERLRRSGLEVVVHAAHAPLPTDPWLCIHG